MTTETTKEFETPIYEGLRRLRALRDSGIDVSLDDLFNVAEKGDRHLSVKELIDRAEAVALRRRR